MGVDIVPKGGWGAEKVSGLDVEDGKDGKEEVEEKEEKEEKEEHVEINKPKFRIKNRLNTYNARQLFADSKPDKYCKVRKSICVVQPTSDHTDTTKLTPGTRFSQETLNLVHKLNGNHEILSKLKQKEKMQQLSFSNGETMSGAQPRLSGSSQSPKRTNTQEGNQTNSGHEKLEKLKLASRRSSLNSLTCEYIPDKNYIESRVNQGPKEIRRRGSTILRPIFAHFPGTVNPMDKRFTARSSNRSLSMNRPVAKSLVESHSSQQINLGNRRDSNLQSRNESPKDSRKRIIICEKPKEALLRSTRVVVVSPQGSSPNKSNYNLNPTSQKHFDFREDAENNHVSSAQKMTPSSTSRKHWMPPPALHQARHSQEQYFELTPVRSIGGGSESSFSQTPEVLIEQ